MKKTLLVIGIFALAFTVLLISIFDSSIITYPTNHASPGALETPDIPNIDYPLPKAGRVLPDSPLWKLKAIRDRVWFEMTTSHLRKAQLALLFADKRLVMSQELFAKGETDIALQTFTKAEKYLPIAVEQEKIAREHGTDTNEFLMQLAFASLKHKEVAARLIQLVPENARSLIAEGEIYAEGTYKTAFDILNSKGIPMSKNPFDGD